MLGLCPISARPIAGEIGWRQAAQETPPWSVLHPSWLPAMYVAVDTWATAARAQSGAAALAAEEEEENGEPEAPRTDCPPPPPFAAFQFWCGTCCAYHRDDFARAEIGDGWTVQAGEWEIVDILPSPSHSVLSTADTNARIDCTTERPDEKTDFALTVDLEHAVNGGTDETRFLVYIDDGRYAVEIALAWDADYAQLRRTLRLWEITEVEGEGEEEPEIIWTLHAAMHGTLEAPSVKIVCADGKISATNYHATFPARTIYALIPADVQSTLIGLATGDVVTDYARFTNLVLDRAGACFEDCAPIGDTCVYFLSGGYGDPPTEEWEIVSGTWTFANEGLVAETNGVIKTACQNPAGTNDIEVVANVTLIGTTKVRVCADYVDADNYLCVEFTWEAVAGYNDIGYAQFLRRAGGVDEEIGFRTSALSAVPSGPVALMAAIRIKDGRASAWAVSEQRVPPDSVADYQPIGICEHSPRTDTAAVIVTDLDTSPSYVTSLQLRRMAASIGCNSIGEECPICQDGTLPTTATVTFPDYGDAVAVCERQARCGFYGSFEQVIYGGTVTRQVYVEFTHDAFLDDNQLLVWIDYGYDYSGIGVGYGPQYGIELIPASGPLDCSAAAGEIPNLTGGGTHCDVEFSNE